MELIKPIRVDKIDNENILYTFEDDITVTVSVFKLETRDEALLYCQFYTRQKLKEWNAYENLGRFENNFDRHRNYEIEDYLEWVTGKCGYRIVEKCPFNNFSWFDGK